MSIVTYSFIKDFLNENLEILLKEESINQLLIFNTINKKDLPTDENLHVGKVLNDNNELSLIYVINNPYNLLIYSTNKTVNIDAVKTLAEYLVSNNIKIKGINANKAVCDIFVKHYKNLTKCNFIEYLAMDIMEISTLNNIKLPKGTFRQATLNDLSLLSKWNLKFALEATNEILDFDSITEKMKNRIEQGIVYLFEDENGHPVSTAIASRQLKNSVCISLVYTDEPFRRKGYGSAVVYNLTKVFLEKGNKFCSLFVDKYNPISNSVYRKLGYEVIDNNYDYRIS